MDVALRSGAAIERTFLSVRARVRGGLLASAGLLAREPDGSVPWVDAGAQALRIRADLEDALAVTGATLDDVVSAEVSRPLDPAASPEYRTQQLVVLLGLEAAAVRAVTVAALNRPEYLVEVAVVAAPDAGDGVIGNPAADVPVGVPARWSGDLLHVGGHCDGLGPDAALPARYRAALESVLGTLATAGLGPADLVQTTTCLLVPPTADELVALGAIRRDLLDHDLPPAGTMLTVSGLPSPGSGVQISGIAMRRPG